MVCQRGSHSAANPGWPHRPAAQSILQRSVCCLQVRQKADTIGELPATGMVMLVDTNMSDARTPAAQPRVRRLVSTLAVLTFLLGTVQKGVQACPHHAEVPGQEHAGHASLPASSHQHHESAPHGESTNPTSGPCSCVGACQTRGDQPADSSPQQSFAWTPTTPVAVTTHHVPAPPRGHSVHHPARAPPLHA